MTWPSRICFSLLVPFCAMAAQLAGRVELADSQDASVRKHQNYSGVVVWLDAPNLKPASPKRAEMLQKRKAFQPHVLAIPVGSTVDFPNFDPIFHNAFSNFSGQTFDVGLYAPGTNRSVHFRRPGMVRVFCNIHPTMSAIIAVLNTPYFVVTDRRGAFQIGDVAAGDYRLRFFHERASAETLDRLERPVKIDAAGLRLPTVRISESGYISVPHKNKYGKEYPAAGEDHILYPGAKK
jgi:plastocyanin